MSHIDQDVLGGLDESGRNHALQQGKMRGIYKLCYVNQLIRKSKVNQFSAQKQARCYYLTTATNVFATISVMSCSNFQIHFQHLVVLYEKGFSCLLYISCLAFPEKTGTENLIRIFARTRSKNERWAGTGSWHETIEIILVKQPIGGFPIEIETQISKLITYSLAIFIL